jgi:hypothetical protein
MSNGGVGAVPENSSSFVDLDSGAQHKSRFGFLRGRKKSSDADKNGAFYSNNSRSPPPLVSSRSVESFQNHSRVLSSTRALPPLPIPPRVPSESSSMNSGSSSTNANSASAYTGSFGALHFF